jgi:hypothetical protein
LQIARICLENQAPPNFEAYANNMHYKSLFMLPIHLNQWNCVVFIHEVLTKFQTPQIVHGVVPRFDDLIGKKVGFEGGGAHTVTLGTLCSSIEELPTFCWELLAAISNGQSVSVNDQAWRSLAIDMTQFSSALQGGEF